MTGAGQRLSAFNWGFVELAPVEVGSRWAFCRMSRRCWDGFVCRKCGWRAFDNVEWKRGGETVRFMVCYCYGEDWDVVCLIFYGALCLRLDTIFFYCPLFSPPLNEFSLLLPPLFSCEDLWFKEGSDAFACGKELDRRIGGIVVVQGMGEVQRW